jgi:hypothetical protein
MMSRTKVEKWKNASGIAKIVVCAALMIVAGTSGLYAAPILITTAAGLGANDSVIWSQLGADGATIPNSFSATSTNSLSISGSLAGTDGCVAVVGGSNCSWAAGPGFAAGNFVLWAEDSTGAGSGPLTLSFPAVMGAGLWLQANAPGQFTARIEAFNGGSSLGAFTSTSNAAGDGIFIGVLDTVPDITKIGLSLTSCGAGCDVKDFGVNSLLLNESVPSTNVPEPASAVLLAIGGLALFLRKRRVSEQIPNK